MEKRSVQAVLLLPTECCEGKQGCSQGGEVRVPKYVGQSHLNLQSPTALCWFWGTLNLRSLDADFPGWERDFLLEISAVGTGGITGAVTKKTYSFTAKVALFFPTPGADFLSCCPKPINPTASSSLPGAGTAPSPLCSHPSP